MADNLLDPRLVPGPDDPTGRPELYLGAALGRGRLEGLYGALRGRGE
jgi:hypothetical protein